MWFSQPYSFSFTLICAYTSFKQPPVTAVRWSSRSLLSPEVPYDLNVLYVLILCVWVCVHIAPLHGFEACQVYDTVIPVLILCVQTWVELKSCASSFVWSLEQIWVLLLLFVFIFIILTFLLPGKMFECWFSFQWLGLCVFRNLKLWLSFRFLYILKNKFVVSGVPKC